MEKQGWAARVGKHTLSKVAATRKAINMMTPHPGVRVQQTCWEEKACNLPATCPVELNSGVGRLP